MQLWPKASSEKSAEERAKLQAGKLYKVVFKTKDYFERAERKCFYPWVEASTHVLIDVLRLTAALVQITFEVANPDEHYHIPLLISPYSYTTYRGS